MNKQFAHIAIVLLSAVNIFAQTNTNPEPYRLRGTIIDQHGAVVPSLSLSFKNEKSGTMTDINGRFEMPLAPGDYEMTASEIPDEKFRVFIKITDDQMNLQFMELIADASSLCRFEFKGKPQPKILQSVVPAYPAAAKAVRAGGTVSVTLVVDRDGKVSSAKAVSGHPLLRAASEIAAAKFLFETSDDPSPREAILQFIFLVSSDKKADIKRFECPYRILVVGEAMIIQTVSSDPGPRRKSQFRRLKHFLHF